MIFPFISIIIPCRDEEKFIGKCLDSIIQQNYPKDRLEVLVVDGASLDQTKSAVEKYAQIRSFIRLLENPRKVTPAAMNIGIRNSKGDVIILVNAHSILGKQFLEKSIDALSKTDADAVGGMLKAINEGASLMGRAILLATDSIFGTGGKRYRSRLKEGFVKDTLPYCAYRREVIERVGLIDEDLIRDQDEELNYRILKQGGRIFYSPHIKSYLFIRPSLKKLWRQHFQYGFFKPLVVKKVGGFLTWRQAIPSLFVSSLALTGILSSFSSYALGCFLVILACYLMVTFFFSFQLSIKEDFRLFSFISVSFATLHVSYGIGYMKGIFDFIFAKKHLEKRFKDLQITR